MSVNAFVFVECVHARSREVQENLLKIGGVTDAKIVTGPYDIIAVVEASSFKVLGDVVISKIQSTPDVKRTLTNVILD